MSIQDEILQQELSYYGMRDAVTPTQPSKLEQKANKLAARAQTKQSNLYNYDVAKIDIGDDADTPTIDNNPLSTRIRGIDSMETFHGDKWLNYINPQGVQSNKVHVNQQKRILAPILGKPLNEVTDQDVFAYGNIQKDQIGNWLGGAKNASGEYLPAIGLVEQTLNSELSPEQQRFMHGRNLGTVKQLSGAYTDMQGVEHAPDTQTWGSGHQYTRNDPYDYNLLSKEAVTPIQPTTVSNVFDPAKIDTSVPLTAGSDNGVLDAVTNVARAGAGGVLSLASSVSKSPKKLYEFLGGDYLEDSSAYSKTVKGVIDTMAEGGKLIDDFNNGYVDIDKSKREALEKDIGKHFDNGNYLSGFFETLADNPLGALEYGAASYSFSKALTSTGVAKVPGLLAATVDNADEASTEFVKVNKRPPTDGEKAIIAGLSILNTAVDSAAAGVVFKGAGANKVTEGISKLVDAGIEKLPLQTVQSLITKPVINALGRMSIEGIQEGPLQEGLKQLAANQNDISKITDPEVLKAIYVQGIIGAMSAPGMQVTGVATELAGSALKGVKSLTTSDGIEALNTKLADIATNIKGDTPSTTGTTFDTATAANPQMDAEALKTEIDRLQRAKLDTEESGPVAPINRDAYIAAMEAEREAGEGVDAVNNVTPVYTSHKNYTNSQAKSVEFDKNYKEAMEGTKEFSSLNKDTAIQEGSTDQYKLFMAQEAIPAMQELMEDVLNAIGDDPVLSEVKANKHKVMIDQINNLITLANSPTVAELDNLVNSKIEDGKSSRTVAAIIGSSAASQDHINKILNNPEIKLTELEKTALEVKKNALNYTPPTGGNTSGKNAEQVAIEKLVGGGVKPGVMQYVAMLEVGNAASIKQAVGKINEFKASQEAKLESYKAALDAFDTANNMSWSTGADTASTIDNDVKARLRSEAGVSKGTVKIGEQEYKANALSDIIKMVEKEQVDINHLADLASKVVPKSTFARPVRQDGGTNKKAPETNTEVPTTDEVVTEDKEVAEAPTKATEAPSDVLPTASEVASKIATGATLTVADEQVQANEGKAVEAELQLLKEASSEQQKQPSKAQTTEANTNVSEDITEPSRASYAPLSEYAEENSQEYADEQQRREEEDVAAKKASSIAEKVTPVKDETKYKEDIVPEEELTKEIKDLLSKAIAAASQIGVSNKLKELLKDCM